MAGDALLDRGPSRLSVFSDADDLFDNQMADFSPEEEARMLTAMLLVPASQPHPHAQLFPLLCRSSFRP